MSENILKLIPSDEKYIPEQVLQKKAQEQLDHWMLDDKVIVETEVFDEIAFIDSGQNFESIFCPICSQALDDNWWQQKMDEAYQSKFNNLDLTTPCCRSKTSLNHLVYKYPCGFARYVLAAHSPQIDITEDQVEILGGILNTELRKIQTRY